MDKHPLNLNDISRKELTLHYVLSLINYDKSIKQDFATQFLLYAKKNNIDISNDSKIIKYIYSMTINSSIKLNENQINSLKKIRKKWITIFPNNTLSYLNSENDPISNYNDNQFNRLFNIYTYLLNDIIRAIQEYNNSKNIKYENLDILTIASNDEYLSRIPYLLNENEETATLIKKYNINDILNTIRIEITAKGVVGKIINYNAINTNFVKNKDNHDTTTIYFNHNLKNIPKDKKYDCKINDMPDNYDTYNSIIKTLLKPANENEKMYKSLYTIIDEYRLLVNKDIGLKDVKFNYYLNQFEHLEDIHCKELKLIDEILMKINHMNENENDFNHKFDNTNLINYVLYKLNDKDLGNTLTKLNEMVSWYSLKDITSDYKKIKLVDILSKYRLPSHIKDMDSIINYYNKNIINDIQINVIVESLETIKAKLKKDNDFNGIISRKIRRLFEIEDTVYNDKDNLEMKKRYIPSLKQFIYDVPGHPYIIYDNVNSESEFDEIKMHYFGDISDISDDDDEPSKNKKPQTKKRKPKK